MDLVQSLLDPRRQWSQYYSGANTDGSPAIAPPTSFNGAYSPLAECNIASNSSPTSSPTTTTIPSSTVASAGSIASQQTAFPSPPPRSPATPRSPPPKRQKASMAADTATLPHTAPTGFMNIEDFEKQRTSTPVLISSSRSSEHIAKLNHLCQERGLKPIFEFRENIPQMFMAEVTIGDIVVMTEEVFGSKREAKEAAAEKAVVEVSKIPKPGKVKGANPSHQQAQKAEKPEDNYIGVLLEHANATNIPQPLYKEYRRNQQYSCEVYIGLRPNKPFGNKENLILGKKAARYNAAKEAVVWLRANGHIGAPGEPIRKKPKNPAVEQALRQPEEGESYAKQVNDFAPILGLPAPTYDMQSDPSAQGLWSVTATFPSLTNVPEVIGSSTNVFGKKNAKEECAKQVVAWMEAEATRRREEGRKKLGL